MTSINNKLLHHGSGNKMDILSLLCWECITKRTVLNMDVFHSAIVIRHLDFFEFASLVENYEILMIDARSMQVRWHFLGPRGDNDLPNRHQPFWGQELLPNSRTCLSRNVLHTSSYWVLPIGCPRLLEKGAKLGRLGMLWDSN